MRKFIKVILIIFIIISLMTITSFATNENQIENQNSTKNNTDEQNDEEENSEENNYSDRVEELKEKKEDIENQSEESNEQLQFVSEELSDLLVEVSELTQSIYEKQTEIEQLTTKSEKLSSQIEEGNKRLVESRQNYEEQKEILEKRLVAMYEMGETSYLDLLLNSKGLSNFISNYYYISEIANTDNELLNIVRTQKESIEKIMKTLEKKETELTTSKQNLEKATIAISNMVIVKNQKMQELSEEEANLQQEIEQYQAEIQQVEAEIRLLSLSSDTSTYVGGMMSWPVPGYTRISSPFGMRTHPITGVYKLHTGTDIGAPYGATFIASNDGIVTKAGFNTAYGNMVIIDHGGGISTLYAHGSEILVQVGQVVTRGTPVLKVGSTGYSTGPHAHFEIRINGEYVNPLDYISSDENGNARKEIIELEKNNSSENENNQEETED